MATNNDSKILINPTRNDCPDTEKVKLEKVFLFPFPILWFIPGFYFLKLTMNELFCEKDTQCRLCENNKAGAKWRELYHKYKILNEVWWLECWGWPSVGLAWDICNSPVWVSVDCRVLCGVTQSPPPPGRTGPVLSFSKYRALAPPPPARHSDYSQRQYTTPLTVTTPLHSGKVHQHNRGRNTPYWHFLSNVG